MSEPQVDDFDEFDDGQTAETAEPQETEPPRRGTREFVRHLESERDTFRTERDTLAKQVLFLKSGIDPDDTDPRVKLLVNAFNSGGLKPEELGEYAASLGLITDTRAAEMAAHARLSNDAKHSEPAGGAKPTDMNAVIRSKMKPKGR